MRGKKICITVPEEIYTEIEDASKRAGFLGIPAFIRHEAVKSLRANDEKIGKIISVPVDNYEELQGYVKAKKLNSIAIFAAFAMEQQMQRVPLTEAQKSRLAKEVD